MLPTGEGDRIRRASNARRVVASGGLANGRLLRLHTAPCAVPPTATKGGCPLEPNYRLQSKIRGCTNCRLHALREGIAVAAEVGSDYQLGGLAIMAEAPGQQEDATGRPFVGKAGKLLDSMCAQAGAPRGLLVLLNRVRCRPPRNRLADYPDAVVACDKWTLAELEEYQPSVVILMGLTAATPVFGKGLMRDLRGQVRTATDGRTYLCTYHPAATFRGADPQLIFEDIKYAAELWQQRSST